MIARVWTNRTADPDYQLDEQPGDRIEVVGWVSHGGTLNAVYRDDDGMIHEIPAWAIRLQPAVLSTDDGPVVPRD